MVPRWYPAGLTLPSSKLVLPRSSLLIPFVFEHRFKHSAAIFSNKSSVMLVNLPSLEWLTHQVSINNIYIYINIIIVSTQETIHHKKVQTIFTATSSRWWLLCHPETVLYCAALRSNNSAQVPGNRGGMGWVWKKSHQKPHQNAECHEHVNFLRASTLIPCRKRNLVFSIFGPFTFTHLKILWPKHSEIFVKEKTSTFFNWKPPTAPGPFELDCCNITAIQRDTRICLEVTDICDLVFCFFATIMWDVCFFHSRWQNNGKMHVSIAAGYKLPFPVWIHSPKKPASISLHLFHQWHFRPSITSPNPPVVSSRSCFFWRTHGIVHLRVLKHLKQRQDNHNLGGFCWREIRCGPQLKQKATTSFRKWL